VCVCVCVCVCILPANEGQPEVKEREFGG